MLDRTWGGSFLWRRVGRPLEGRKPTRAGRRPQVERLEGRQLMTASLAPISAVTVPAGVGFQVPLNGSGSGVPTQTFTVTSSNPNIKATVAQGEFITLNVTHTASSTPGDISFSGPFTYQLFQDLTPNTASRIQTFTNAGGYNGTQFFRVVQDFSGTGGPGDVVIQGGPQGSSGSGTNPLELNQQLAFLQPGTVAIANAGANTDGQQFFVTTGPQTGLNFGYTIYGEVVAGMNIVADIGNVTTHNNTSTPPEKSVPDSPVNITSATVSPESPDGVVHINATGATAGQTSTITVTATDPSTHTTATQSFNVTVGTAETIPTTATFPPTTNPPSPASQTIGENQRATFNVSFSSNNLSNNSSVTTSFATVTQPAHGTVAFNTTTNTAVYTPNPGFTGTDSFTFRAVNNNSTTNANPAAANGNVQTATVTVLPSTNAVRVIGNVLVVTPPPTTLKSTNTILVAQQNDATNPANDKLTVTVNGLTDPTQPLTSAINRIVVYGSKASDNIQVAPTVNSSIAVTLDGGHAGKNTIVAGAGPTREHGWFGQNTLIGGTGTNQLVGRAGHVKFKPTVSTNEIFAGVPRPGYFAFHNYHNRTSVKLNPPGGTFYKSVNGKLVPIPTPPSVHNKGTAVKVSR
jgi:cyclophilin family peptidyl-prolyl cis-trans isomerase